MNTEAELAHETGTAPPFSPDPGISAQWHVRKRARGNRDDGRLDSSQTRSARVQGAMLARSGGSSRATVQRADASLRRNASVSVRVAGRAKASVPFSAHSGLRLRMTDGPVVVEEQGWTLSGLARSALRAAREPRRTCARRSPWPSALSRFPSAPAAAFERSGDDDAELVEDDHRDQLEQGGDGVCARQ
jgi:hypothetical protein